jgi:hypothetical protein
METDLVLDRDRALMQTTVAHRSAKLRNAFLKKSFTGASWLP